MMFLQFLSFILKHQSLELFKVEEKEMASSLKKQTGNLKLNKSKGKNIILFEEAKFFEKHLPTKIQSRKAKGS